MERKRFKYITTVLLVAFTAAVTLCSCSKDDVESGTGSTTEINDSKSWYFYESPNAFDNSQANADYNSDRLNYYNYIDEYGCAKKLAQVSCVHFVNKNTLEIYYFTLGVEGCKESLSSKYYIKTPYYIGNDKLIYFSGAGTSYTYVEVDGKIMVTNGDIYTRTSNGITKDGTSLPMTNGTVYNYDYNKKKQIADACAKVSAESTCDYNDLTCTLSFNSSLGSLYPNESFVYGVEYGISKYDTTIESESRNNPVTISFAMLDQQKHLLFTIILKLQHNVPLTSSERSYYNQLHKTIDDMMSRGNHEFVTKCYVRYGGTRYYIDK